MPSLRSSERRLSESWTESQESYFSVELGSALCSPAKGDTQDGSLWLHFLLKVLFCLCAPLQEGSRTHRLGRVERCDDVEPGSAGTLRHSTPVGAAPVLTCVVPCAKLHLVPAETLLNIASEMFLVSRLHPRAQNSCCRSGPGGRMLRGPSRQLSKVRQRPGDCSHLLTHRVQSCECPHTAQMGVVFQPVQHHKSVGKRCR